MLWGGCRKNDEINFLLLIISNSFFNLIFKIPWHCSLHRALLMQFNCSIILEMNHNIFNNHSSKIITLKKPQKPYNSELACLYSYTPVYRHPYVDVQHSLFVFVLFMFYGCFILSLCYWIIKVRTPIETDLSKQLTETMLETADDDALRGCLVIPETPDELKKILSLMQLQPVFLPKQVRSNVFKK